MVGALVRFDHLVVFAYRDAAPPVELYSTFNAEERIIYVTLYQEGPYLLDPFYHTARQGAGRRVPDARTCARPVLFQRILPELLQCRTGLAEEIGFLRTARGWHNRRALADAPGKGWPLSRIRIFSAAQGRARWSQALSGMAGRILWHAL